MHSVRSDRDAAWYLSMRDPTDPVSILSEENEQLRRRVAELERAAMHFPRAADGASLLETLPEREALLLEAERIAHVGSWAWDHARNRVFWSDELFRILGYDPRTDEASTEAFFEAIHPDDVERVRAASARGVQTGVSERVDFRVRWRDGTIRYVSMNGALLFDEARVLRRIVGTVADVTALREAARTNLRSLTLLEDAQRVAGMGSWALSVEGGELEWSTELFHLLGVPREQKHSLELFFACFHDEDRARMRIAYEQALSRGEEGGEDGRIVRPDGSLRHVHFVVSAVRDAQGKTSELRAALLDVTERVELEAQLVRAQRLEALGRLAGGISHDFNNLLTVILANVDLLSPRLPEQLASEPYLSQIAQAAELAASLTRQLLAFGRKAPFMPVTLSLSDAVAAAIKLVQRLVGEDVEIASELAADLGPVFADPSHLQQILMNLIVNARDAMPQGGVIRVTAENVRVPGALLPSSAELRPGDYVLLSVHDAGAGMDELTRQRIFEPFFTTKQRGRGTGLGLSVVFGAVSQHGGFVHVDSTPGKGSTFHVYLPCRCERSQVSECENLTRHTHESRKRSGNILVVEDETNVASVIRQVLESAHYHVRVATRPSEALALWPAVREQIDLVICDIVMPEMRGTTLIQRLFEGVAHLNVLFVTGYGPDLLGDDAATGSHHVLQKPFRADTLLRVVAKLLEPGEVASPSRVGPC